VDCFTIRQKYNAQVLPASFRNLRPPSYPTVRLNDLFRRLVDGSLNPIPLDDRSIWALPHLFKVSRKLHEQALRERISQSSVSA
jgi:hypothetical protein